MSATKKNVAPFDGLQVKGMFRVQIEDDGEVIGDTGWKENQITNLGFNNFLVSGLGAIAGSAQVKAMALGTGGYPNPTDTVLAGEISGSTARLTVTAATSTNSKTVHFTGTFQSANSFLGGSSNISNIGLFNTTQGGTMFSGNTFASSACATNQNVNCTYDISFS